MQEKDYQRHRGKVVQKAVEESYVSKTEISERAHIARATLYRHFKDPEMPYGEIKRIYEVIGRDFSYDFPEAPESSEVNEPGEQYAKSELLKCKDELLKMHRKYNELLEKYYELKEGRKPEGAP